MSGLQTASVDSTASAAPAPLVLPLVLVADADAGSRARRARRLGERGFRVVLARTPFETIVKASCHLPDLILIDWSLGAEACDETTALLTTCPATAHIPIVRLTASGRIPSRVFALSRWTTTAGPAALPID